MGDIIITDINADDLVIDNIPDIQNINEDIALQGIDETFNDPNVVEEIEFIKGNKGAKNPGKLIIGRQQFVAGRVISSEKGERWYYECARKHEGKGKGKGASCSARTIVDMDLSRENWEIVSMPKVSHHNHICDEARVIKWKIMDDMEKEFLQNLAQKPSIIRKRIIVRYITKYQSKPNVWREVQSILAEDHHIDRMLNAFRQGILGNLPR